MKNEKVYISEISKGGAVTVAFWRLAGPSNHNKVKLESLKPRHFTSFLNESHKLKWNLGKNKSRGWEGGINRWT